MLHPLLELLRRGAREVRAGEVADRVAVEHALRGLPLGDDVHRHLRVREREPGVHAVEAVGEVAADGPHVARGAVEQRDLRGRGHRGEQQVLDRADLARERGVGGPRLRLRLPDVCCASTGRLRAWPSSGRSRSC